MHSIPNLEKKLALAQIQVLKMWINPRYRDFLIPPQKADITEEWFNWFAKSWSVARTIRSGCLPQVRNHLNTRFRAALQRTPTAATVDKVTDHLQWREWSAQTGTKRQQSRPVSLVSKIGFFLCPDKLVPLDSYSLKGLNLLLKADGKGQIRTKLYKDYLSVFDEYYASFRPTLSAALQSQWCTTLAKSIGCPSEALTSEAMRRKLFDDLLMHMGGYEQ